ncbi:MAG: diheme cytochrome c [Syntrophus sp. (in: bacteria)]
MKLKFILLLTIVTFSPAWSFAGEHNETKALSKVTNEAYKKNCGTCHFAYQPELLPVRSWLKIINNPGGHPGGDLSVDNKTKAEIEKYLNQNSAEKSQSKISRKIIASIGNDVPSRISEVPYIRDKHRKIKQEVFSRKSIGSRGNCITCHKTAERGDYDDDNVTIPK